MENASEGRLRAEYFSVLASQKTRRIGAVVRAAEVLADGTGGGMTGPDHRTERCSTACRSAALAVLIAACAVSKCALAGAPQRVVCLAPSLTETVFALGAGDAVVGVGDYARWPEHVDGLPRLGGLYDVNVERVVALRPDLVLVPCEMHGLDTALPAGVPVEPVPMDSIATVLAGIDRVAHLLGREAAGRRLAGSVRDELNRVRSRCRGGASPSVLVVVDRASGADLRGLVVAGPDTFLAELVEIAGGRHPFPDADGRYFSPSVERLIADPPDLVIELRPDGVPTALLDLKRSWRRLVGRRAAPEVRVLTDSSLIVPGPRLARAARLLRGAIERAAR